MLTKEQVIDLFKNTTLKFKGYYKYTFGFSGSMQDYEIYCSFGGDSEDIYREDVKPERSFMPFEQWRFIQVTKFPNESVEYTYRDPW